jgi:signal transduction histidine kinase/ActR/RegA family two-component response regulator
MRTASAAGNVKRALESGPQLTWLTLALALAVGIFFLDLEVPLGSTEWLLYLFPVFLIAWASPRSIMLATILCSLLTVLGFLVSQHGVDTRIAAVNRGMAIGVFWALAAVMKRQRRAEAAVLESRDELEVRVKERTAELARANEALQKEMAERQKAEEHLRQTHKLEAIGTLASGIAHDFNSLLSVIVTNAELALLDRNEASGARRNLEEVVRAGLNGRDLVQQILTFCRKSEKKDRLSSVTPTLKDTFRMLRASIPTTVDMQLVIKAERDLVLIDPSQIQQLVMNLCTNAAQAMQGKIGKLEVSLSGTSFGPQAPPPDPGMSPGDYLVLSVSDAGCGMDKEVKRRIFEPFFTTKSAGEGTGLGLSVVYGIIKSHGGGITVDSEPGKGSVFTVYLPTAETAVAAPGESEAPFAGGDEHIMVVDDDPILAETMREMLRRLGYQVTVILESMAALRQFGERPAAYDLVILDQTMPLMTGKALAGEMLALRPDLPIILCTGYSEEVSAESARAMGVQGFLMKPFTMREGATAVRKLLDRKKNAAPGTGAAPA